VHQLLDAELPLISWINLGEVHYVLRRLRGEEAAGTTIRDLREVCEAALPDEQQILDAARIKADHPMSYADAFAAALTMDRDAELWTGDPELLRDGAAWRWRDLRS
jgi:predicted nucleic acid-binding protein